METHWIGSGTDKLASNSANWDNGVPTSDIVTIIAANSEVIWDLDSISISIVIVGTPKITIASNCIFNASYYVPESVQRYVVFYPPEPPHQNRPVPKGVWGATITWSSAGDATWSTAANWVGGVAPTNADTATFDGTSTVNCTFDASAVTPMALDIAPGYIGCITLAKDFLLGTSSSTNIFTMNTNENYVTMFNSSASNYAVSCYGISGFGVGSSSGFINFNNSIVTLGAGGINAYYIQYTFLNYCTFVFTVTASMYMKMYDGYYNGFKPSITINLGVTWTNTGGTLYMLGQMTVNGTCGTSFYTGCIGDAGNYGNTNPIVLGGSYAFGASVVIYFAGYGSQNCPAISVPTIDFGNMKNGNVTLTGNVIATVGDCGVNSGLIISSYTLTIPGALTISGYLTATTGTINCVGAYTCTSTSASWSLGTSTINFNGTAAQTLGLNNGNSSNITYYNITISNSGAVNVTMGANNLNIDGLFNCSTTTATILWSTNNGTLNCAAGLTLANGCGWTKGAGIVTFDGTQTVTDNNATKNDLGTVVVSGAIAVNFAGAKMTTLNGDNASGTANFTADSIVTGNITGAAGFQITGTVGVSITKV